MVIGPDEVARPDVEATTTLGSSTAKVPDLSVVGWDLTASKVGFDMDMEAVPVDVVSVGGAEGGRVSVAVSKPLPHVNSHRGTE